MKGPALGVNAPLLLFASPGLRALRGPEVAVCFRHWLSPNSMAIYLSLKMHKLL